MKLLTLFFLAFLSANLNAQTGENLIEEDFFYSIEVLGDKYSSEEIRNAFTKADMCGFFFDSDERKLMFDDGSIVTLKSFNELPSNQIKFDGNCVTNFLEEDKNIYSIHSSGVILIAPQQGSSAKIK